MAVKHSLWRRSVLGGLTVLWVMAIFVGEIGLWRGEGFALNQRRQKDSTGREWLLQEWKEGTRPYPKSLRDREIWYLRRWGENWYGVRNGRRIHNPGNWKWEEVVTVPPDLARKIVSKKLHSGKPRVWGDLFWAKVFVWAQGGDTVTDIYARTDNGFYHYDPMSGRHDFIGSPVEGGKTDGLMGQARLNPGDEITLDPITGRLYFIQGRTWRYVEKLLPYEGTATSRIYYLPAVLDWHENYRMVKSPYGGDLKPVIKDGKRAAPLFVVRSNPALKTLYLPGASRGKRPLITPDGKGVYFSELGPYGREWDTLTLYDKTALFDIETGRRIRKLRLSGSVPPNFRSGSDGPGSHGGNCLGYDGKIYTCQHGGSGGGPGRMFSIDPEEGTVVFLYNSVIDGAEWRKRKSPVIDGPADALSLDFTSTLWQVQCPRTGAIINGGWDNSGIRRYHDGFVTSIVNGDQQWKIPPRPGWVNPPVFHHGNSSPSIAPNGDLYIADDNSGIPRIFRIYRTDWPTEQPVNGYAEKFISRERRKALMLEYAQRYIENFREYNRLPERSADHR
jgi:hypothetical protein